MITLDDDELTAVMTAAKPLPPKDRNPFLRTLAAELEKHRDTTRFDLPVVRETSAGFSIRRSFMVRANTTERIRQKVPTAEKINP